MQKTHEHVAFDFTEPELRIACVADTHSKPHPDLARWLDELAPQRILHAGDIGNEAVLRDLEKLAPVTAVRGNIDDLSEPDIITVSVAALLKIVLTHIAVNGPRLRPDVLALAKKEEASLVVCGHSHVPFANHDRGVTVFNPGSAGPRRFQLPILFGVVRVRRDGVTLEHVDCETGRKWKPTSGRT
ncbi:MAG TPA: metallophosphoesterase family protein [Polyangiaceae bacterium]